MHRKSEMLKENQIQNEEAPRLMNNNVQKEREKKTEKKRHMFMDMELVYFILFF